MFYRFLPVIHCTLVDAYTLLLSNRFQLPITASLFITTLLIFSCIAVKPFRLPCSQKPSHTWPGLRSDSSPWLFSLLQLERYRSHCCLGNPRLQLLTWCWCATAFKEIMILNWNMIPGLSFFCSEEFKSQKNMLTSDFRKKTLIAFIVTNILELILVHFSGSYNSYRT